VTDRGDHVRTRFLILAVGCLSVPKRPEVDGIDTFRGRWYHTGQWPREGVDFTGQRVGVIGTGSSGVQSIPLIARQAEHVTVFQRTANFSVPAHNAPLDPDAVAELKANYPEYRRRARESGIGVPLERAIDLAVDADPAEREARYRIGWDSGTLYGLPSSYLDVLLDETANDTAADFVRARIRELVDDPSIAERLTPRGYPLAAKRLCLDTDYYATFNRPNVTLVDLRETPIVEITETGVRTTGAGYECDSLVFATGFDAMTGPLLAIDLRGRDGVALGERWVAGPRTYLGLAVAGFPNLFVIAGPGSPSVISNMIVSIEQHVEWIADCLTFLREQGVEVIEATEEAEAFWVEHVNLVGSMTLFPRADSWYTGANVPGKPRVFMPYVGGVGTYRRICAAVADQGYEGFALDGRGTEPFTGAAVNEAFAI
jgi:cyclohexanone monooxygenase